MSNHHGPFPIAAWRDCFVGEGRFRDCLGAVPTFVIDLPTSPALLGSARAVDMGD